MQFIHSDLGIIDRGATVKVDLEGTEANVQLLDDLNFQRYRRRERHQYFGGHFTASPALITVPSTGSWHVVVDLGGRAGSVRAAVTVLAA